MKLNSDLRIRIVQMISKAKEGHIPSSFSIVDTINFLYEKILRYDPKNPNWKDRDYFILSKGHGAAALFAVFEKFNFIRKDDIGNYSNSIGILGGHPDSTNVPGVEASTGSLGHGFPFAVGIAMGLIIKKQTNKVFCLVGDGECQEGTIWESANIAANQHLKNLTVFVDWNGSAAQLLPIDDLENKWKSFGWSTITIDGHDDNQLDNAYKKLNKENSNKPRVILLKNIKGKGVSFLEGHGSWHHKIPTDNEYELIVKELNEKN
jgi:transketolase